MKYLKNHIKFVVLVFFCISSIICNSQIKLNGKIKFDTIKERQALSMFPNIQAGNDKKVAYFVNGKLSTAFFIRSINERFWNTSTVQKKEVSIAGKKYDEQLYITTKANFEPKFLAIKEIKTKHAIDTNLPCFYFIDGKPVNIDGNNVGIDENNLLQICCHLYNNEDENFTANVIEIFTHSKQNIEKGK
jgi:hypothetical protein